MFRLSSPKIILNSLFGCSSFKNFNVSDKRIDLQIDALNGEYFSTDSRFTESFGYKVSKAGYLTEGNTNSGISFYNYKSKGGAYSRTENNNWYYDTESYENEMKSKLFVDPAKVVNIYISDANGYLGWAYFPYDYSEDCPMHEKLSLEW